jgi:hypothetical protein
MSKNINQSGFVFSLEATIAILIFSLLLITINFPIENSLKELVAIQQANDLLKVWSTQYPNNFEITFDTNELFGNSANVFIDEKKIVGEDCFGETISTETIILDDSLIERNFRIIICFN